MKRAYTIWVCELCNENYQFAGFCDACGFRLRAVRVISVDQIKAFASEMQHSSSPLPRYWIGEFVRSLLDWSSSRTG